MSLSPSQSLFLALSLISPLIIDVHFSPSLQLSLSPSLPLGVYECLSVYFYPSFVPLPLSLTLDISLFPYLTMLVSLFLSLTV